MPGVGVSGPRYRQTLRTHRLPSSQSGESLFRRFDTLARMCYYLPMPTTVPIPYSGAPACLDTDPGGRTNRLRGRVSQCHSNSQNVPPMSQESLSHGTDAKSIPKLKVSECHTMPQIPRSSTPQLSRLMAIRSFRGPDVEGDSRPKAPPPSFPRRACPREVGGGNPSPVGVSVHDPWGHFCQP